MIYYTYITLQPKTLTSCNYLIRMSTSCTRVDYVSVNDFYTF